MMRIKFLFLFFSLNLLSGQSFSISIEDEINSTWFTQDFSMINEDVKNPHRPSIGFKRGLLFQIENKRNWVFSVYPSLATYNTKSNVTSDHRVKLLGIRIMAGRDIGKRIESGLGIEYAYLASFSASSGPSRQDLTFFANHRSFINPFVQQNFNFSNKFSASLNFTYFIKSLFNSGALNDRGEIVVPIPIRPFVVSFGIRFKLLESSL